MPNPILDYLEYNGEQVTDFFAIINPENQNVLGVKKSSDSKYLFSHYEAEVIINSLSDRFIEDNADIQPEPIVIEFDHPNNSEFTYSVLLGCLLDFQQFLNLPVENISIGLSCTNDYSYEGQLEVSLWYQHNQVDADMMVFDKWTVSSSKEIFRYNSLKIDPNRNSFEGRGDLINSCLEDIYNEFYEALSKLKEYVQDAHQMRIRYDFLVPVFLNIRDKNRSVTALKNSEPRRKSLEKEIRKVENIIGFNTKNWTYLDFLEILSAFKFENNFHRNFIDFKAKLNASNDYKDLLNTVDSLNTPERKDEFEAEQLRLYHEIRNVL
jgi:hypothetical protein